jgi:hypothetical protein
MGNTLYGSNTAHLKKNKMRQNKVEKSFLNFKANHPEWKPSANGEKYLETLSDMVNASQVYPINTNASSLRNRATFSDEITYENVRLLHVEQLLTYCKPLEASSLSREPFSNLQDSMTNLNRIHRFFYRSSAQSPSDSKLQ